MWRDRVIEQTVPGTLKLASPISLTKVLWFGTLFIAIQIAGTLLTRRFGSYGMLATGIFGGLVSSASTTAAAATLAMHGNLEELSRVLIAMPTGAQMPVAEVAKISFSRGPAMIRDEDGQLGSSSTHERPTRPISKAKA